MRCIARPLLRAVEAPGIIRTNLHTRTGQKPALGRSVAATNQRSRASLQEQDRRGNALSVSFSLA